MYLKEIDRQCSRQKIKALTVLTISQTELSLSVAESLGKNMFIIFSYTMGQIRFFFLTLKLNVVPFRSPHN